MRIRSKDREQVELLKRHVVSIQAIKLRMIGALPFGLFDMVEVTYETHDPAYADENAKALRDRIMGNADLRVLEPVKVITEKMIVQVCGISVTDEGDYNLSFRKVKKDGTPYRNTYDFHDALKVLSIEKIENQ